MENRNGYGACMSQNFVDSFNETNTISQIPMPKYTCDSNYDFSTKDFRRDDDAVLLARMIFGECDGCSKTEKTAVGMDCSQ